MKEPSQVIQILLIEDNPQDALLNARLLEQTHHLAEQLALVNDIGEELVPLTDPKSLLELATQRIAERLGYYFTGIFIQEIEGIRYAAGYSHKNGDNAPKPQLCLYAFSANYLPA